MLLVFATIFLLGLAGAQDTEAPDPFAEEPPPGPVDAGTELLTAIISSQLVQSKLQTVYQFVDLKIRFVKLVKSLLSRANLVQLRRILDFAARACNFVIGFLPEDDGNRESFLEGLFPLLTLEDPDNPVNVQRVNREVEVSSENPEVNFTIPERHREDVVNVARLIYNAP